MKSFWAWSLCAAVASSSFLLEPSDAHAFNLGYHRDMTVEALRQEGFSENAISMVLAGNFGNDILGTPESYMLIEDDVEEVARALAEHLHFDQLFRPEMIDKNFRILVKNARATVRKDHAISDLARSQKLMLLALGSSLHTVQDFYAHSNWADLKVAELPGAPPDATYFDVIASDGGLLTPAGLLDDAVADYIALGLPRTDWGFFAHWSADRVQLAGAPDGTLVDSPAPKHAYLCKDWASRAYFDAAYRAAFKATLQWIALFRHVLVDPAPDCSGSPPAIDDAAYWENLKQYTQSGQDEDVDDVEAFTKLKGTAHFMGLYGGAWKQPERWSGVEIVVHDLPDLDGFGAFWQLVGDEPDFAERWLTSALDMGDGQFEAAEYHDQLDQIVVSRVALAPSDHVLRGVPFHELPDTDTCEIDRDMDWLGTSGALDYVPNWVKLAAPFDKDNDDGDGWFNFNDEDPGTASDYYAVWRNGPDSGSHLDYFEAITRGEAQSFNNWQTLLPLGNSAAAPVSMQLLESDDVDIFDGLLHIASFTLFDPSDDLMDISPNGADALAFSVQPRPFGLMDVPAGVTVSGTPYGALIQSSGRDDDFLGDFTASVTLQASPVAPPTRVRLIVFELQAPAEEWEDDESKLIANATVDEHKLYITADELRATDEFPPTGNSELLPVSPPTRRTLPGWTMTYEGYVDDDEIPISFEVTGDETDFRLPAQGRFDLVYHLGQGLITGHAGGTPVEGVNGQDITYRLSTPEGERLIRFRILVEDGAWGALPPPQQVAEYFCGDPQSPDDNHIRPRLRIRNKGEAVPLSEFTLRYWYTSEGFQPESSWLDYVDPSLGAANVTRRFVKLRPRTGSDGYLELGFTPGAGNLGPNSVTPEIQLRFNKGDWSNYREAGDYSYDAAKTSFTEWPNVTLYRNNVLIFGKEPTPLAESQIVRSMDVFMRDEAFGESNFVKPRFYLVNTGNVTIPAFHLRYHFMVENGKTPELERWYLPDVIATLQNLGNDHWIVDYRFQGPQFGPGAILPDQGGFASGIHYDDWSHFDKTNDFSNPGSATFVKTNAVEVTFD